MLLHLPQNIVPPLHQHHLRPTLPRHPDLPLAPHRRDRPRPFAPQDLTQPRPDAPARRQHQHPVAPLHPVRLLRQRQRREPLQDRGAGVGARDGGRDPHRLDGGHGAVLGVAARAAHPDDAVARVQAWRGGGDDAAGGFFAEDFGLGGRVEAGAEVAANEDVSPCAYIYVRVRV